MPTQTEYNPDILRTLLQSIQAVGKAFMSPQGQNQPTQITSPTQQTTQPNDLTSTLQSQFKMPSMIEQFEGNLNPLQEVTWKAIKKYQPQLVGEALQQGVPAEHIMSQVGSSIISNQTQTTPQTDIPQPKRFGPFEETPQDYGQRLQNAQLIQQLLGEQPAQKGQLELLEKEYGYKLLIEAQKSGLDPNSPQLKAQIFQSDLVDLVDTFERIPIKGKGLGGLSALAAGTLQIGKQARAEYESKAEAFVYSFASYVAQQQGRALDKEEVKRFRNIVKLQTGDTRGSILGKIQAMIDLANTRAKSQGLPKLPNANELVKKIKQDKQTRQTDKMSRDVGSIQSELEDINKRLRELGE